MKSSSDAAFYKRRRLSWDCTIFSGDCGGERVYLFTPKLNNGLSQILSLGNFYPFYCKKLILVDHFQTVQTLILVWLEDILLDSQQRAIELEWLSSSTLLSSHSECPQISISLHIWPILNNRTPSQPYACLPMSGCLRQARLYIIMQNRKLRLFIFLKY